MSGGIPVKQKKLFYDGFSNQHHHFCSKLAITFLPNLSQFKMKHAATLRGRAMTFVFGWGSGHQQSQFITFNLNSHANDFHS